MSTYTKAVFDTVDAWNDGQTSVPPGSPRAPSYRLSSPFVLDSLAGMPTSNHASALADMCFQGLPVGSNAAEEDEEDELADDSRHEASQAYEPSERVKTPTPKATTRVAKWRALPDSQHATTRIVNWRSKVIIPDSQPGSPERLPSPTISAEAEGNGLIGYSESALHVQK